MSFGKNPHVAKAEAEEQKAQNAKDQRTCEMAWREGARYWDRAAERETDEKRRKQYEDRATTARANADEARASEPEAVENLAAKIKPPSMLN